MGLSQSEVSDALTSAQQAGDVVRVDRATCGPDRMEGVVVARSDEWLLLNLLDWDTILNGHAAIRVADVTKVDLVGGGGPETFTRRALTYFHQIPSLPTALDLASTEALVRSAGSAYPVVALHTETQRPDVCFIGRVEKLAGARVTLREINSSAVWETGRRRSWKLKDITRVDVGGRYEEALVALAGGTARQGDLTEGELPAEAVIPSWVDTRLGFLDPSCHGTHYLVGNPHTFSGRISAWCPKLMRCTNVSKSDVHRPSAAAVVWLDGYLAGSEPAAWFGDPDFDYSDDDPRTKLWVNAIRTYRDTGVWSVGRTCEVCGDELLPSAPVGLRCDRHLSGRVRG